MQGGKLLFMMFPVEIIVRFHSSNFSFEFSPNFSTFAPF